MAAPSTANPDGASSTSFQRMRLYGPSLVTLAVLLPFFAYYLHETKSAQGYLNDRAFRILDVMARQFGSEISGVGNTMDAANILPEQLSLREGNGERTNVLSPHAKWLAGLKAPFPEVAQAEIQAYLNLYIRDGVSSVTVEDVSKKPQPAPPEAARQQDPDSPPQVSICCRSGNSSLRVRLLEKRTVIVPHQPPLQTQIDTRLDPDQMIERALGAGKGSLFETVFLASRNGDVLAEMSSSKLNVRDVEAILANRSVRTVIEGGQNSAKQDSPPESPDQPRLPREVWGSDQRFDVQVSGTSYVLFVAPAPFVLNDEKGVPTPIAFYGLTQKDAIDAQARRLPSLSVPVIFILLIVGMAFLWPALKLYTMSERDRLTKFSVFAMLGVTLVAVALLGTLYLSYGFFLDMSERDDNQIVQLSDQIRAHFAREIGDAIHTSGSILSRLKDSELASGSPWPQDAYYLLSQEDLFTKFEKYPFLGHVILLGSKPEGETAINKEPADESLEERQIIKFSSTRIPTPLIPLPASRYAFLARLLHGQSSTLVENTPGSKLLERRSFSLQSIVSPSTGEFLPTLAFNPQDPADRDFHIMATTQFPSLVHAILPQGFSFALLDPNGEVLFDSDPSRNLHENFFGETEDADELKAVLRRNEHRHLWLRYGGREIRAYVQPLGEQSEKPGVHDLDLTLITFLGMDDQKELLSSVGANFLVYLLGLPLLLATILLIGDRLRRAVWPAATIPSGRRRMWPRRLEKPFYLLKGMWGLLCFSAAVLIAIVFRICWSFFGIRPLVFPTVFGLLFIVCLIGIVLLRRKSALLTRLAAAEWSRNCESRVPLSAAYSIRIYAVGLAIVGILSILLFQLAVSGAQLRVESENYRGLAAAIENRKDRYLEDFHKFFEKPGRNEDARWQQFCQDRVNSGYDLYDGRATGQPAAFPLLPLAPFLDRFSFLPERSLMATLPDPCPGGAGAPAQQAGFEPEPIWNALPSPSLWYLTIFYLPGMLLLVAIFLWTHRIVRRLFILDFREPNLLPTLDQANCQLRMQNAADAPADRPLDRLMIFAHPRSGTGVALERIVKHLKKDSRSLADLSIVDFGKPGSGETNTAAKIAILDNFEVRLPEAKERVKRLAFLEALVYTHKPSVYVFTSIDPLLLVESLVRGGAQTAQLQSELNRWTRLLGNFERFLFKDTSPKDVLAVKVRDVASCCAKLGFTAGVTEEYCDIFESELSPTIFLHNCAPYVTLDKLSFDCARHFEESLVTQIAEMASGYYRVIWLNCTNDERLALYQLAKDDWLNPMNEVAISHLLQKQLIDRDGAYRLMNVSFRKFVLEAVTPRELSTWQKQQNLSLWPPLRMALALALFLVVLFVSYFWRDVFDVYLSYFVALAGGLAGLFRIVAQLFNKDGPKLAAVGGDATAGEAKASSESA